MKREQMSSVLPANDGGDSGVSWMLLPPEKLISGAHVLCPMFAFED